MVACCCCGTDLPEEADFCLTCGSFLHAEVAIKPATDTRHIAELLAEGRDAEAMTACQEALAANPHDGNTYAALGDIYCSRNLPRDAVQAYRHALKYQPTEPDDIRLKLDAMLDMLAQESGNTSAVTEEPPPPAVTLRNVAPQQDVNIHISVSLPESWLTTWRAVCIFLVAAAIIAWSIYTTAAIHADRYQPAQQATPLSIDEDEESPRDMPVRTDNNP